MNYTPEMLEVMGELLEKYPKEAIVSVEILDDNTMSSLDPAVRWAGILQCRNNPNQYVPRKRMDWQDYTANINRLRNEGKAKYDHADRLEEERNERFPSEPGPDIGNRTHA